jgi:hypothetical protein
MAQIDITVTDKSGTAITTATIALDSEVVTGSSASFIRPEGEYGLTVTADGYTPYNMRIPVSAYNISLNIILIEHNCGKGEGVPDDPCCTAAYTVLPTPCGDYYFLKTTSAPSKFYIKINDGEPFVAARYLINRGYCETNVSLTEVYSLGCCDGDPVYCERTAGFTLPDSVCSFVEMSLYIESVSDGVVERFRPYIDYKNLLYYNPLLSYIVVDHDYKFAVSLDYLMTQRRLYINNSIFTYNSGDPVPPFVISGDSNSFILPPVTFNLKIIDKAGTVLTAVNYTLPPNYSPTDIDSLRAFLEAGINYQFSEEGEYSFVVTATTPCEEYTEELKFYVRDIIEIYPEKECNSYQIYNNSDMLSLRVLKLINGSFEEVFNSVSESDNFELIYVNEEGIKAHYKLTFKSNQCLDTDGIFKIIANNGLHEREFLLMHYCGVQKCMSDILLSYMCLQKNILSPEERRRLQDGISSSQILMALLNNLLYMYSNYNTSIFPATFFSREVYDYIEQALIDLEDVFIMMKEICCSCVEDANKVMENCGCK